MTIPRSTYRLQCRAGLTLRAAADLVGYLSQLGISDVYLSPIAMARPDSEHGYDVCDPNRLDPAVGTSADLAHLSGALRQRGMGLVLDIVPNHLATDEACNAWWRDVLRHGQASASARVFDIDWSPSNPVLEGKVLLPVLAETYGEALERGGLRIEMAGNELVLVYGERRWPLAPGSVPASFTGARHELHAILQRQHYRLAHWRAAMDEINYRRFFNIEHLIGVRLEDESVFDATHTWLSELVADGTVTGLRVDHPDGLAEPGTYLDRLQRLGARHRTPETSGDGLYVVVEKILVGDEMLPEAWPVHGTTGYDFLNSLNGVFIARRALPELTRGYARFVGRRSPFLVTEHQAKREVIESAFWSDLDWLVHHLDSLTEADLRVRDLSRRALRRAIVDLTVHLPVYRTYFEPGQSHERDRRVVEGALAAASERSTGAELEALAFLGRTILGSDASATRERFVSRWQQFTSAVFAKAVEDTAFYRDNTLLSLNEVGGAPARVGGLKAFHKANAVRALRHPHALLTTTTHDTKLSEDVRARLNALSERPAEWERLTKYWRRLNNRHRSRTHDGLAPDRHDEYRLYQLIIGAWPPGSQASGPDLSERLTRAMIKAAREARGRTTWTAPNVPYEQALTRFVSAVLGGSTAFIHSIAAFAQTIARAGMVNSLAQTVLKLAAPGVPDTYQGTEGWHLRLTDPDNRAPVDFAVLMDRLRGLVADHGMVPVVPPSRIAALLESWPDGLIKTYVTARGLATRREHHELFARGGYVPLGVSESRESTGSLEIVSFARTLGDQIVMPVVPRFVRSVTDEGQWPLGPTAWHDTTVDVPAGTGRLRDCFTGTRIEPTDGRLYVREVLRALPVALLVTDR